MSRKKGLSYEEKRTRLLDLFFEKKEFYQLKELEKLAPKEKGITSMSVKDVLQSLVDDSMVDSERIGTSNYFWAYPSKAMHNRRRKLTTIEQQIEETEAKVKKNKVLLQDANKGKEDSEERSKLMSQLAAVEQRHATLSGELDQYKECDPEVIEGVKRHTITAQEAANRWTDNIFTVKSWCQKKFNIEGSTIDKQFGIPEDFDYIE